MHLLIYESECTLHCKWAFTPSRDSLPFNNWQPLMQHTWPSPFGFSSFSYFVDFAHQNHLDSSQMARGQLKATMAEDIVSKPKGTGFGNTSSGRDGHHILNLTTEACLRCQYDRFSGGVHARRCHDLALHVSVHLERASCTSQKKLWSQMKCWQQWRNATWKQSSKFSTGHHTTHSIFK